MVGSTRVAIHEGGRWHRLVVAVRGGRRWRRLVVVIHCCSLWTSFIVVHHALLSVVRLCPSRIVKRFGIAGLAFGIGRGGGAGRQRSCVVDTGGVALVGCVYPVVALGGHVWVSWALVVIWACCVLRASLLPLLGGCGILLGRCCRSWTAGVVSPTGIHLALHGVNLVAKRTWVVASGVSRLWEASLAWWLLVEEETSQGCDFGVTFNTHVEDRKSVV